MSSSRVDLVSFVQIDPNNYQSMPPLPEVVPEAHIESSVHLNAFVLLFSLIKFYLELIIDDSCVGPSGSRTVSEACDGTAGELAVDSPSSRKRKDVSVGSSDK